MPPASLGLHRHPNHCRGDLAWGEYAIEQSLDVAGPSSAPQRCADERVSCRGTHSAPDQAEHHSTSPDVSPKQSNAAPNARGPGT